MPPESTGTATRELIASVVRPEGVGAALIADLWWVMFWIAAVVCVEVFVLLLIAVGRRRRASEQVVEPAAVPRTESGGVPFPAADQPPRWSSSLVLAGGVIVPAVILVTLLVYSLGSHTALAVTADDPLTIEVIGHQWWWEVRYPEHDFTTANEIVMPLNRQVRLELTSVDVIHSLWVPSLNGKMDLIPGQVTELPLEASSPGAFWGICAEYCGMQHAKMNLTVRAVGQAEFTVWADDQTRPAPLPERGTPEADGLQVFLGSACVYCHTIRGTNASGRAGPDLTHLASRLTLGAGALPNTRGNLGGWIVNSQTTKPGNRMPPMYVSGQELQDLLAYLETLQ